jgi:glyoxylase-like metal-dependent hydrolase (beta-lactamase superfamily II)
MEILPGIYHLPIPTRTLPPHRSTNSYVVAGADSAMLIDAICPDGPSDALSDYESVFKNSRKAAPTAAVTHQHPDHYLGLARPLAEFGGKIICHFLTRPNLSRAFPEGIFGDDLEGGEVFTVGGYTIRIIHTPGHSPGHICLYLEEERILFSGDTILGFGTSIISPPEGEMAPYIQSLETLSKLDIRFIFPGHGPIIDKRANRRIRWYIEHRKMRERRVLEAMAGAGMTPSDIAEKIYGEEDFQMHGRDLLPRAARTVLAHLLKLEKEGLVHSETGNGVIRYRLT